MENFFSWMSKPIPNDEVIVWFNIHNIVYEKVELFSDIFKSLNQIIIDTYLGDDMSETKIVLTQEDKKSHFNWCWKKMITNFEKENIRLKYKGEHKNYFEEFFMESFYNQTDNGVRKNISTFIDDIFDTNKQFTKSDLDILTELYKVLDKNLQ